MNGSTLQESTLDSNALDPVRPSTVVCWSNHQFAGLPESDNDYQVSAGAPQTVRPLV